MLSVGLLELALVVLIALASLAIPTATLVVAVLIYRKLSAIERALDRLE
ncbi:MAG: hypothetical protein KGY78_03845 [Anaerolineae bacterium]|nr:hypothetical protein [Anaerolineae bacterium]